MTPVVVVDVWVKAGAIAEPDPWLGMAHFLEHMIFKGTKKLPPGLFDYLIENCGGMTNAATSHDYAHFYLTTSVDQIEHTLPEIIVKFCDKVQPDTRIFARFLEGFCDKSP